MEQLAVQATRTLIFLHSIKTHQVQTLRILHLFLKAQDKDFSEQREKDYWGTSQEKKSETNHKAAWVLGYFWFHVKMQILSDVTLDPKRLRTALLTAVNTFFIEVPC